MAFARSRSAGYLAALCAPVAVVFATTWLALPSFVFEHLVVLLVLGVAVPWGLGPAVVAAVTSVVSDNLLLREPLGSPTITGYRDVLDLLLFATVAVVVGDLVRRAHAARVAAQEAADRERRAREDRDRLIATVTHDLATPLSVLNTIVQLAKSRGVAQLDWPLLLTRLETAGARATTLVRMLSDAQELEGDCLEFALSTHDFRSVVAPIVRMMDRYSERHRVVLSLPGEPITIRADPDRLQRVLENLVNNAIKYSPDGGAIEVSLAKEGGDAVLRVRDHGIGISDDALPHIFDRTFRAAEAAERAPGLGLGLSIAAHVVARHGGTISASRAESSGTTFIVRLPLAPTTSQSQEQDWRTEMIRT